MLRGFTKAWSVEAGGRLRESRVQAKLQPLEVAEEIHKSDKTIYAWEAGTREPGMMDFAKLCVLYGKDPGYILFGATDNLRDVFARAANPASGPASNTPKA